MLRRLPFVFISVAAVSAFGQNAISARSGMVHYVEGRVLLDGKAIDPKFGEFPQVNNDATLCTEDGRAEVLLTPGVFLRMAESTSFRMLSNHLSDTAVEILSGSAMFEVDELLKDNAITVHFKGASIALVKQGLYRFDAGLSRLRVYDGEAQVIGEKTTTAKKGRQIVFGDALQASSFDTKISDPFYRWAARRSEYISEANVSSARTAYSSGMVSNNGSWSWNPWFGMFTYLPGVGYGYNPFGWAFFSPYTVGYMYVPYYYGGYGATTTSRPTLGSGLTKAIPTTLGSGSSGIGSAPVTSGGGGGGGIGLRGGGGGGVSAPSGGAHAGATGGGHGR